MCWGVGLRVRLSRHQMLWLCECLTDTIVVNSVVAVGALMTDDSCAILAPRRLGHATLHHATQYVATCMRMRHEVQGHRATGDHG